MNILDVSKLSVGFPSRKGMIHAVNDVSFQLFDNEILGIIGESGSGKSVTVKAIMRLHRIPPTVVRAEHMIFEGRELLTLPEPEMTALRGNRISMIFQNPMSAFNPIMRLGDQIGEVLISHKARMGRKEREEAVVQAFEEVGITNPHVRMRQYPYEFSGGMLQRAMIASALIARPSVLLADEPTTGLDVTIQEQILQLIRSLRDRNGMSVVFITHDLSLLAGFADRIIIMYSGSIVEQGLVDEIFYSPLHPYTKGLLLSIPSASSDRDADLFQIKGQPPDPHERAAGCPFYERCDARRKECSLFRPAEIAVTETHKVSCFAAGSGKEAADV